MTITNFCPYCGSLLSLENTGTSQSRLGFVCPVCPYQHYIKTKISIKKYMKMKPLDDIMGGKSAWENVDSTEATCTSCDNKEAYFMQIQTRSADEPMTTFYRCKSCSFQWKE
ncbi:MAG: DNA-directed RNA polymerase III subunit RPC10 [Marteilia pararefringens]